MGKKEDFLKRFIDHVQEHHLFKSGAKILIGFSGGADSTALTCALLHFKQEYKLTLMAAHVNYHLRGEDSNADERFVKSFCFDRNVNLLVHDKPVTDTTGIENKAREIRMSYFELLNKHYKLDCIALAHHRHDQAETVMSRFLRGSAFTGLKGIAPRSGMIIHPLLPFKKEEIIEFLNAIGQSWCEDKTNLNSDYMRNKIRNDLLPYLEKNFNPAIRDKLCDYADTFYDADVFVRDYSAKQYKRCLIDAEEYELLFDLDEILRLPSIIMFYVFRMAYEKLAHTEKDFYQVNFKELRQVLELPGSKEVCLPHGIIAQKDYEYLRFLDSANYKSDNQFNSREIISLRNIFVFNDKRIVMQKLKMMPEEGMPKESDTVIMDLDQIKFPITVRFRENGDRFIPLGMTSSKKLKDFFIDEKVPKFLRDKVVIFSDTEKIFWVGNYRVDARVAVTENTRNYVMFKIEDLKESKNRSAKKKVKKG